MRHWAALDSSFRGDGILVAAYAVEVGRAGASSDGAAGLVAEGSSAEEPVFAVHAIAVSTDGDAKEIAARMPHLDDGVTEIRPVASGMPG